MCLYCNVFFDNDLDRCVHFIREHHFNKDKRRMFCKICHQYFFFIYNHFDVCHKFYCVNCTRPFQYFHDEHFNCALWFKTGMNHYIYQLLFEK